MKQDEPDGVARGLRALPTKTVEHVRSAHDVRHQTTMRHSTGEGDPYKQLQRLAREKESLERRLLIWLSQKERTEAQIAAIAREQARIVDALEPQVRREAAGVRPGPGSFEPVPLERRSRAG
jgi:hypothetical protein